MWSRLNVVQAVVDSWVELNGKPIKKRHFQSEYEMVDVVARFVLTLPSHAALHYCQPFLDAVDVHPIEVETFITSLISREDQASDEATSFWEIWQAFADRILGTQWLSSIGRAHSERMSSIDKVLFGVPWKEGIHQLRRLQVHEEEVNLLVDRLPTVPPVLLSYTRYLDSIGRASLPDSFGVVAKILQNTAQNPLSNSSTVYYLESMLGRYVYGEPLALKSDPNLRALVLIILDQLVEAGSSASYSMRDDFVTPVSVSRVSS